MKFTALFIVGFFGLLSNSYAQNASAPPPSTWSDIKLGPLFSAGEAVSAGTVANGAKTANEFAFSAGANADFPLNPNISLDLAIAYDAREINFHDQDNTSNGVNYNLGYYEIRPEFRFSGFLVGVGIGLPASISSTGLGTLSSNPTTPSTSDMKTLFELRLGGAIPVVQSAMGVLNVTIEASYAFTQITNVALIPYASGTPPPNSSNNGPLATAELGLQYLFDLNPH